MDRSGVAASSVVEVLNASSVYREYHSAFTVASGMPLALRSPGDSQLPFQAEKNESAFCALLAKQSPACATCQQFQEKLLRSTTSNPTNATTLQCPFGLTESIIPIKNGTQQIAVLWTGQVFRKAPVRSDFQRILPKVRALEIEDLSAVEQAYFANPVLEPKQYDAFVVLLTQFAQQLAAVSNEVVIQQANGEPVAVTRAREYIRRHNAEELSLKQVASAVNTSASYFCRLFKRSTGMNYSQYRARVRLEYAKELLLNPNLRVGEIAYEVGFQSLTHFNRVFKKLLGQSPSEYRAQHLALWS